MSLKFSRKSLIATGLIASASFSAAQGLYSIAPNDDEASDSLPLNWTAGVSIGYDDNPTPLFGGGGNNGALFVSPSIRASLVTVSPQTTYEVYGRLGAIIYLEGLEGDSVEDITPTIDFGLNITHRVNERLRLSSRNNIAYQLEPDFDFGRAADRRSGAFLRYSTSNSIGYRWSERFATVTGLDFSGVIFEEGDNDFTRFGFRQQFRYRVSPQTVLTAGYRYHITDSDSGGSTDSHSFVGGIERKISAQSALVVRAGVQTTSPDNGSTRTRPFVEGTLRSQLTQQLGLRAFVRYSQEEWNRGLTESFNGGLRRLDYEGSDTLRFGLRANYSVNPRLSLYGGANLVITSYDDLISNVGPADGSESVLNLNTGASYQMVDNLFLTGSYNFTTSESDFGGRDYERNRFQLGIQTTF